MSELRAQTRLAELLSESRAVELAQFDQEEGSTILVRVVPEFTDLLRRGRDLLSEIERLCAAPELDESNWAVPERAEELENLCFFVEGEWRRALEGLERLNEATPGWNCLVQIERARDRLVRGLKAVEQEYAAAIGSESRTDHVDLLRDALQERRILTRFRRRITEADSGRNPDLDRRIHLADSALEELIHREEFARLRAADRHLARDLHRRVGEWLDGRAELQGASGDGEPAAGEGLWRDVVNFAALLWDINRRDELVKEDLAAIDGATRELRDCSPEEPPPSPARKQLRALFGRDDELDDLLEETTKVGRIRERLGAVRQSLDADRTPRLT